MTKKNDLSSLLSKKVNHLHRRHNNYHPNTNNANNSQEDINNEQSNNQSGSSPNVIQKKVTSAALTAAGVPKGLADNLANNEQFYKLAQKGNFTMKMPLPMKITITSLMILVPFVALMLFVVLFGAEVTASSTGNFAYGQTCTTVTVNNTDCDANTGICSNKYDGDKELADYIAGVVAAEVGEIRDLELYKTIAITTRTYLLENVSSSCTVEGNMAFKKYMDVDDSPNADLIKKAVEDTENLIIVEDEELIDSNYDYGYIENQDNNNYYIGYGYNSLNEIQTQAIPKNWIESNSLTDKLSSSNKNYDMSIIGAMYLSTNKGYNYEEIIEYYYGEDSEIIENEMQLIGVDGFINPTRYIRCSSAFGYRIHPVKGKRLMHTGLDIGIPGGEPIYAAKSGEVIYIQNNITAINNCNYGYGNYIWIDHKDGTSTLYAHIKYGTIPSSIYMGATVMQGEQIGEVGSTGCSTGNHLHYEVRINREPVDPADYLDLTDAKGTCRR